MRENATHETKCRASVWNANLILLHINFFFFIRIGHILTWHQTQMIKPKNIVDFIGIGHMDLFVGDVRACHHHMKHRMML